MFSRLFRFWRQELGGDAVLFFVGRLSRVEAVLAVMAIVGDLCIVGSWRFSVPFMQNLVTYATGGLQHGEHLRHVAWWPWAFVGMPMSIAWLALASSLSRLIVAGKWHSPLEFPLQPAAGLERG